MQLHLMTNETGKISCSEAARCLALSTLIYTYTVIFHRQALSHFSVFTQNLNYLSFLLYFANCSLCVLFFFLFQMAIFILKLHKKECLKKLKSSLALIFHKPEVIFNVEKGEDPCMLVGEISRPSWLGEQGTKSMGDSVLELCHNGSSEILLTVFSVTF